MTATVVAAVREAKRKNSSSAVEASVSTTSRDFTPAGARPKAR
jgi:hypothetical protein